MDTGFDGGDAGRSGYGGSGYGGAGNAGGAGVSPGGSWGGTADAAFATGDNAGSQTEYQQMNEPVSQPGASTQAGTADPNEGAAAQASGAAEDRYEILGRIVRKTANKAVLDRVAQMLLAIGKQTGDDVKALAEAFAAHKSAISFQSVETRGQDELAGCCLAVLARLSPETLAAIDAAIS